ncbi:CaiB/BaiF CoA-transferase family protein [Pigmentiphaga soli]|uniref:CaiB/BaiF CoA-transferase family protein n=1 Tax=Pigmentiphaga soli TaxID=1007095 RepID=A0ABP8HRX3_9BURK
MNSALEGLRILDLSQVVSGPVCTQMLADFGADVVKIERPGSGDLARNTRPQLGGFGANFLALNRNKRSLAVDLSHPEGKDIVRALARRADVLVENFRPGVLDKLGLGYEALAAANPGLVYASISGFGQTGPYRDRKGQDILAQALGGMMWRNGARDDPPTFVGFPVADFMAGTLLCQGILIALQARQRSGRGQRIETNLLDSVLWPQLQDMTIYLNTRQPPARPPRGGTRPHHGPTSGVFKAQDGYLVVTLVFETGNHVSKMCALLGLPDLGADPRYATPALALERYDELRERFAAEFAKRPVREWIEELERQDVMCAPVQAYEEIAADPQILHNGSLVQSGHPGGGTLDSLANPLRMSETPWHLQSGPPALGGHTDQILAELGLEAGIADLRRRKVVA